MKAFKINTSRRNLFFIISLVYFTTRLVNLLKIPIFNDEAIYLDWGFKEINSPDSLFLSLFDAKQPLLMWVFGIAQKIISDPLLAGRLVSVLAGYLSLTGIYFISSEFWNKKAALIASILYITSPLFLFYDRQALMESAVSAVGIWSFYFIYKTVLLKHLKYSLFLGVVLGIGFFIKSSALVFLASALLILIIAIYRSSKKEFLINSFALIFVTSQIVLIPLYMQSAFWENIGTTARYAFSIPELFKFPLLSWITNFAGSLLIIIFWVSPIILVLSIAGSYYLIKKEGLTKLITIWIAIGYSIFIFTVKTPSVRYLISFLPLMLIPASFVITQFKRTKLANIMILSLTVVPSTILSIFLIFSPLKFFNTLNSLTKYSQKSSYVSDWTAGYGIPDAIDFIKTNSNRGLIGVRLDAGNPESAILAYFNSSDKYMAVYFDQNFFGEEIFKFDCLTSSLPFYFVSRDDHQAGLNKFLAEERRFYKPESDRFVGIYTLKKECSGESLKLF